MFSVDVSKWAKKANAKIEEVNKAIVIALFTSVIMDTPVLEGRLRGNWIISSENPANGTIDVVDPRGNKTVKKAETFIRKLNGKKDFSVYLTNNLPYAYRIEYDGWSKDKAPAGMVRKNLIRISENLAA